MEKKTKESLKEKAYREIKERILDGRYAPGSNLNEDTISNDIGMSRTPIRDALVRLDQEFLLTVKPKKGIKIKDIDLRSINAVYEARLMIEPYSLEKYGVRIGERKIVELYDRCRAIATAEHAIQDDLDIDSDIHLSIVNATENEYLIRIYSMIRAQSERFRILSGSINRAKESNEEHMRILNSCIQNEWGRAAEEMRDHLKASQQVCIHALLNTANNDGVQ